MAKYLIKPVVWNTLGYRKPSGAKFTSGYPKDHGFGHEEWNNSDELTIKYNGEEIHVFHTLPFGKQDFKDDIGEIFVFMVASHNGDQYLVAVAGKATYVDKTPLQKELMKSVDLEKFREQAWDVSRVQTAYDKDKSKFNKYWNKETKNLINFYCQSNLYLALPQPVKLNAPALAGKQRLITMFNSYQKLNRAQALRIFDWVQNDYPDNIVVQNLKDLCGSSELDLDDDIADIEDEEEETTQKQLIDARKGQGKFRSNLLAKWSNACAVSGISIPEILRASHIKPWRDSNHKERLDPHNGLLLCAQLDALFDAYLITFEDDGEIRFSSRLTPEQVKSVNLGSGLRKKPGNDMLKYLQNHRKHFRA